VAVQARAAEGSACCVVLSFHSSCTICSAGSGEDGFCCSGKAKEEQTVLIRCSSIL